MAKNNHLINTVKNTLALAKQGQYNREMIAAFALAMKYGTNLNNEQICELLGDVQRIWNIAVKDGHDLLDWCEKECDISVRDAVENL